MTASRFFSGALCFYLLIAATVGAAVSTPTPTPKPRTPVISAIRGDGKGGALATVTVPTGTRRVTLQALSGTTWKTRSVAHVNGSGSNVVFNVPVTARSKTMRVIGCTTDTLPATFYSGTTNFATVTRTKPQTPGNAVGGVYSKGVTVTNAVTDNSNSSTVVEADIWKLSGNTLFFFNQYRGLQVIDLTDPDNPVLKSRLSLAAVGEDMYVLDPNNVILLARKGSAWDKSEAIAVTLVSGTPTISARLPINGSIVDSRLVGTALYVASTGYQSGSSGATWQWGTQLSSFDFSDRSAPVARNTLFTSGWSNVTAATDRYLFAAIADSSNWSRSQIQIVDISAANGTMVSSGTIVAAGIVQDKFKLGLSGSVLTVISQVWPANWSGQTSSRLETFSLADPSAPAKLGEVSLGTGDWLYGTRFDGDRAYVVTAARMDPLWVIDLSNPASPTVTGSLEVPGFSTYLQPLDTRLLTLGVVNGQVAVSMFDVADPAAPALLGRVTVGGTGTWSWSEATFNEKAFTVLKDGGLILLPVNSYDSQTGEASQVQLVSFDATTLTKRGVINAKFGPRRTAAVANRIVSVSGRELLTVNATDQDAPVVTQEVTLAWPVNRLFVQGDYILEIEAGNGWSQSAPTVRVGLANEPDSVVSENELTGSPICGATVHNGKLYLAQADTGNNYGYRLATLGSSGSTVAKSALTVSIFDLGALPALTLTGTVSTLVNSLAGTTSLEALWPAAGSLVWAGNSGYSYYYPMVSTASGGVAVMNLSIIAPWWQQGSTDTRLYTFNVSTPAAPTFLGVTTYATDAWNRGGVFAGTNAIFSSHSGTAVYSAERWGWMAPRRGLTSVGWGQGWFLDVIDFTNPAAPVVRDPISIPSKLAGVSLASTDGAVLFGVGAHSNSRTTSEYVDASAYDGVSASLIGSVSLGGYSSATLVTAGAVLVARSSGTTGEIGTFTLTNSATLAKSGTVKLSDAPSALRASGNLLAARISDGIHLFDQTHPATLLPIGTDGGNEPVWGDISYSDGAIDRGLWVPLGEYGVEFIESAQ